MTANRLTLKSQEALQTAQTAAMAARHPTLEPMHLLEALIRQEGGLVRSLLEKIGVAVDALLARISEELAKRPTVEGGELRAAPELNQLLADAEMHMNKLGDQFVSAEHLLFAMLRAREVGDLLRTAGVTEENLEAAITDVRGIHKVVDQDPEAKYQALEKYAKDLTALARQDRLDPVIGRDEEIRRILQVLSRRTKNNPILVGDPGVGKTAIVEGLAQRIVAGDVPETLKDKKVMALDMGALIAGAKFRGEFEDRLKGVLEEITASDGNIVLFIDEIHTLVGAGGAEGAMDAANLLKPALARGDLRCVGATTLDEFRKHIEKDAALERRFQPVLVEEPDLEDTIAILRGLKGRYEVHHGVRITDSAIIAATTLSDRYIADRFLPDKAIDLIDEAASKLRMEIDSLPTELDQVERRIRQLEIEREALKKEKDRASKERLEKLEREMAEEREVAQSLRAEWQAEKDVIDALNLFKAREQELEAEAASYERDGNFEKVAEIRYGKLPGLAKQMEEQQARLIELQSGRRLLKEEVDDEDVAAIISKWTGIPVSKLVESEKDKLIHMEARLEQRVVGQSEAISAVSNAVRRSRAGLQDPNRPIGSFLFMGPTGVGKTELAKALAEFLFNDERAMVRIDMSEFSEKHSVARLIGAPPGYVGYEEGGYLTEAVRRRPYAVVLLDEIEKAHHEVFNILLQVLDDGRLTDGQGRTVNFKHSLFIMTSNIGGQILLESDPDTEGVRERIEEQLSRQFRPEFLNRIDEVVLFHRLGQQNLRDILEIQIAGLLKTLAERNITLQLSDKAKDMLAFRGYDPAFGARPLKRLIQQQIQNPLANLMLSGEVVDGCEIRVEVVDGRLEFETRTPEPSASLSEA